MPPPLPMSIWACHGRSCLPSVAIAGLIVGGVLALPSTRLDGLYYALLTLGMVEICRVFVQQMKVLAPANGSINAVGSFIPAEWFLRSRRFALWAFSAHLSLLLLALLLFRLINSERLGMLLQTARDEEAFAEAIGIDFRRARMMVFVISSAGLGVVGAFYAMFYSSISPAIFSLDQLLLLFAMMFIGGLGRADGRRARHGHCRTDRQGAVGTRSGTHPADRRDHAGGHAICQ